MLEIKVPTVGESISEVTVSRWLKNDGDFVEMDEVICELESDKATFELNATASGLLKRMALEGDTIPIGSVICGIDTDAKGLEKAESKEGGKVEVKKAEAPKNDTVPSPQAKKEETKKPTTGSKNNDLQFAQPVTFNDPSLKFRGVRVERMSSLRKTIARRLVAVKNDTAMLTTFNEVDMKPVMELRAKYKDMFKEKHGVGLGFMSFFTKAVCEALHDFPSVGAQIEGENLVYYDYADISIAVSTEKGLVVPVIRNAEKMSMAEIEKEILNLATKARENKLTLEEMTGGTFTITNGGVFGSMLSTPIINAPQSAILGMHNIVERPVVVNKEVVIRPIMYVALSYDHRIIDGKESVGFLVKVKQVLENPERLLLEV